jgi:hypothetical protein
VKDWPGLRVAWSKVAGPGDVDFSQTDRSETTAGFSEPGVYVLALAATCHGGAGADRVSINVLPAGGDDPNLVGYWPLDGKPEDVSGRGNHATLQGATFSSDSAPTGVRNHGSLRVTPEGYAAVPHSDSLNAPTLVTVALWVKVRKPPIMWPDRKKNPVGLLGKGRWWEESRTQQACRLGRGMEWQQRVAWGRTCGVDRLAEVDRPGSGPVRQRLRPDHQGPLCHAGRVSA